MSHPYKSDTPNLPLTAGEAITAGDLLCIGSDGKAYLADANDATKRPAIGFAFNTAALAAQVEAKGQGKMCEAAGLTMGAPLYLSETPGAVTQTPPASYVQAVGVAETATEFIIRMDADGYAY